MEQPHIKKLGRYDLVEVIGKGGMGEVYRAIMNGPAGFKKEVAVKLLHESVSSEKARQELVAEARLGGMFKHINLVEVQDLGSIGDRLFVVMEMIEGVTFKQLIRNKELTPQATLEIAQQVCAGLDYAHKLKVQGRWLQLVHCDLKPSNILVSNTGVVKIADFGIAHAVGYTDDIDGIRGTPAYMSPEQTKNEALSAGSDIFSLGLCLFEAFTGRKLVSAKTLPELVQKLRQAEQILLQPENISALRAIHPQLLDVLRPCFHEDVGKRYSSASVFQRRLAYLAPLEGAGIMGVLSSKSPKDLENVTGENFILSERSMTRGNLPPSTDVFIGRDHDIQAIIDEYQKGASFVTLQGPGGVGKTQLAIQAAYRLSDRFTGGLWFIDLSEASSVMDIVKKTAEKKGIPLAEEEEETAIKRIGASMQLEERNLYIFDNFEQIVPFAQKTIGYWSQLTGSNAFMVTSQVRLSLPNEKVHVVMPLSLDDGMKYLQTRLHALGHQQEWTEQEKKMLENIVHSLDGLPLALEMIASRMRLFTLEQIHQRLQERFQLLQDRKKETIRHASIYNAIDWSWSLLSDVEKSVFAQLACFRGGFTLSDAEGIIDISAFNTNMLVMDVVEQLLDKSLVFISGEGPRFSMLRSIFAFAEQKLAQLPDVSDIYYRHAHCYSEWSKRLLEFYRHGGDVLLANVQLEVENIKIAFEHAKQYAWVEEMTGLARIHSFLTRIAGPETEGVSIIQEALQQKELDARSRLLLSIDLLQSTQSSYSYTEILSKISQCRTDYANEISPREEVELYILESRTHKNAHVWELALQQVVIAREMSEKYNFRHLYCEATILYCLIQSKEESTYQSYLDVIDIMKNDGNLLQLGFAWMHFGQYLRRRRLDGDFQQSKKCLHMSQQIAKKLNNRSLDADVSMRIANLEVLFGRSIDAERNFQRSYELYRRLGRTEDTCLLLGNMASWCIHTNNPDRGWRMLLRAKKILDGLKGRTGFTTAKMIYTGNTAIILNIRKQYDMALPHAEMAWKLAQRDNQNYLHPFVAIILLETLVGLGRIDEAKGLLPVFDVQEFDSLDDHGQVRVLLQQGMAAILLGDQPKALNVARVVYDKILANNLEDLEVRYEYNKLIMLLYAEDK